MATDKQNNRQTSKRASKSFMAVGPTLHYSHKNVQTCWFLALGAFVVTCFFWSKLLTGTFWSFSIDSMINPQAWRLGKSAMTGVSIFEYPWHIAVLGLLMAVIAVVPLLVSQLMCFSYSVPFLVSVFLVANLPAFSVVLLVCCIAAACRPLRFRSRFIAVALCTAPELLYWGFFGGIREGDPMEWGLSFSPWIFAWIVGLGIVAIVLGTGHFTRYRPGLLWLVTSVFLLLAVTTFEMRISFAELDYQLYVAENNPEHVPQFQDHSLTALLDRTITNPPARVRRYFESSFYPSESIALREALKSEIQRQLHSYGRWPWWLSVPSEFKYQSRKRMLFEKYDYFIQHRPQSRRMSIALYYKAILSDYSPDVRLIGRKELLCFRCDFPHPRSRDIWYWLYTEFPDSPESLEARWRIGMHQAGDERFEETEKLLFEAQKMLHKKLEKTGQKESADSALPGPFRRPAMTVITVSKLNDLQVRLHHLQTLINIENRSGKADARRRLAKFITLNPYALDYEWHLDHLLEQSGMDDPLRDNLMLAKAELIADVQLRSEKLSQIHEKYQSTDGGMLALYRLGQLKMSLYQGESQSAQKSKYLADARATLGSFVDTYPDTFYAEQFRKNLDYLPSIE